MEDDSWQDPNKAPAREEVAFDYIKGDDFRVIWADGAIGGVTPRGYIHCALYAERQAIPRRQVHALEKIDDSTSTLGAEIPDKRISRGSIVREMACDVFMSVESAERLAHWLLERVDEVKRRQKEQ